MRPLGFTKKTQVAKQGYTRPAVMIDQFQADSPDSQASWRNKALIWLTLLLAFRLAALALNRTDLMFDEAQYWSWAQEPAFGYFSKPPLLAWIIGLVTGVCGDGEACVRAASPLLYWGAGLCVYFAAEALYGPRTGFWSALVFSTLPGVSFSSGLISTDVPLLLCWSAALLAWVKLLQTRRWRWAIGLGLVIGLGLNAKYAMAYFFLCAALYLTLTPKARWLLRDARILPANLLPLLLILPNLVWNAQNGFLTLAHTAANAKWSGTLLHPDKALKFLAEQFGVFGPVLFALLLWIGWQALRRRLPDSDRLLLIFSVPVIALIVGQALLSRAHANWAAVAYPAAAILVTDFLLRQNWRALFTASLALHAGCMILISAANWAAPALALPGRLDPYKRMLGWRNIADAARRRLDAGHYTLILTEDRWVAAELLYYLRDARVPLLAWRPLAHPRDHFELTRPFTGDRKGPHLLVTLRPSVDYITRRFQFATELESETIASGPKSERRVRFFALDGHKVR